MSIYAIGRDLPPPALFAGQGNCPDANSCQAVTSRRTKTSNVTKTAPSTYADTVIRAGSKGAVVVPPWAMDSSSCAGSHRADEESQHREALAGHEHASSRLSNEQVAQCPVGELPAELECCDGERNRAQKNARLGESLAEP